MVLLGLLLLWVVLLFPLFFCVVLPFFPWVGAAFAHSSVRWCCLVFLLCVVLPFFSTPLSPTGTEEGQDRRGGLQVELFGEDPEASPSPGDRHRVLSDGRG